MIPGQIPPFLDALINSPPAAGSGVHDWMFDVARNLHAHMPAGQIESLLRSKLATCGRPVPDREIKDAIRRSIDFAWQPKGEVNSTRPTFTAPPKPNPETIEHVCRRGARLYDLWEQSPIRYERRATEQIIDQLFPGNPLLCCGKSAMEFETKTREEWRCHLARQAFIVPSPMSAKYGLTQNGTSSMHSKANTGPRRFLIVEFDFSIYAKDKKTETIYAPIIRSFEKEGVSVGDMCAALLLCLNETIPMTLAVSSGGKSIHGWWYCSGVDEGKIKSVFWKKAIEYGADPKTWLASQFVRMPDGTRENGVEQAVLYFNPSTLPAYAPEI